MLNTADFVNIISYLFSIFTTTSECHLVTGFVAWHVRQIAAGTSRKQALKFRMKNQCTCKTLQLQDLPQIIDLS